MEDMHTNPTPRNREPTEPVILAKIQVMSLAGRIGELIRLSVDHALLAFRNVSMPMSALRGIHVTQPIWPVGLRLSARPMLSLV